MSRSMITIAAFVLSLGAAAPAAAQANTSEIPEFMRVKKLPRQKMSGPRLGLTVFTGEVAEQRNQADLEGVMSQFGWQFETQIVSIETGSQALLEWVFLVGGVEQDELNLSVSWLAGYRLPNGLELGAGPNLSYNADAEDFTRSMILAAGARLGSGGIYIPLNFAVGFAKGGPRITTLLGWVVG